MQRGERQYLWQSCHIRSILFHIKYVRLRYYGHQKCHRVLSNHSNSRKISLWRRYLNHLQAVSNTLNECPNLLVYFPILIDCHSRYVNCYTAAGIFYGNVYTCPGLTYFDSTSSGCHSRLLHKQGLKVRSAYSSVVSGPLSHTI